MNRIDRPLLKIEVRRIGILFVVLPLILGFKNYAGDPYSSTSTDTALDACPTGAVTMSSGSLSIGHCTISGNISLSGSASVKVMSDSAVFSVNNDKIDLTGSSQLMLSGATLVTNGKCYVALR
jgi:hypothetical protein